VRKPAAAPHLYPDADAEPRMAASDIASLAPVRATKRWVPRRVLITPSAAKLEYGRAIASRAAALGSDVVELRADRVTGLRSDDPREEYARAKSTLAIVVAPGSKRTLQPIPPSADWRVDLAEGCPAHCQYCYLAGSLTGPPITRVYANLDEILDNLRAYAGRGAVTSRSRRRSAEGTTFEASCYTDPLALEHLTASRMCRGTCCGHGTRTASWRWIRTGGPPSEPSSVRSSGSFRRRRCANCATSSRRPSRGG
jgi:spore photoproduct lyase